MKPSIPLRSCGAKGAAALLLTLWLAKTSDPGVTYYVMDGADEIGEVQELDENGYVVRLDGLNGADVVLVTRTLKEILPAVRLLVGLGPVAVVNYRQLKQAACEQNASTLPR